MAAITGKDATIKIAHKGGEVANLLGANNWQITVDVAMIEDTDFETDGWVTNLPGNRSWTGTIDFSWQVPDASTNQAILEAAALNGTLCTGEFTTDGTHGYKGDFYVNSFPVTVPQGDRVTCSVSITGNGKLEPLNP